MVKFPFGLSCEIYINHVTVLSIYFVSTLKHWYLNVFYSVDSSPCLESQREAALLLGQFATADSDCKVEWRTLLVESPVSPSSSGINNIV